MKGSLSPTPAEPYAFCEPLGAGSRPHWHIRSLTASGRKESGGADTTALCGRVVAWDLGNKDVAATIAYVRYNNTDFLTECCSSCVAAFDALALASAPTL